MTFQEKAKDAEILLRAFMKGLEKCDIFGDLIDFDEDVIGINEEKYRSLIHSYILEEYTERGRASAISLKYIERYNPERINAENGWVGIIKHAIHVTEMNCVNEEPEEPLYSKYSMSPDDLVMLLRTLKTFVFYCQPVESVIPL